ncbi:transposase [Rhodovulum sulfidophilum]|nr:transposase [Rhodovulum sulfidophilum]
MFSDAAIQFSLMMKVLFGLPLRRPTGRAGSILEMTGLDWPAPDFSTLRRRQKNLAVQIPYRRSAGPLNLLVDRTGIKVLGQGGPVAPLARRKPSEHEWLTRKHDPHRRGQYRKIHLAMDDATGDVRAVEFTPGHEGDSPDQVPADQKLETVTGDGGYDTRPCHTPILEHGGVAPKLRKWIEAMGAKTACIEPGSHRENACRESFNARFYNEMLHREVYSSLRDSSSGYVAPHAHCPRLQPQATQSIMDVDRRPVMH